MRPEMAVSSLVACSKSLVDWVPAAFTVRTETKGDRDCWLENITSLPPNPNVAPMGRRSHLGTCLEEGETTSAALADMFRLLAGAGRVSNKAEMD